ncbi:Uncharacterized protein BP5553_05338 [Venustampulla echinocandica]|uniref:AHC1-like C2H2 zinc-finger domain-containing protein n=1 Tax=Venustampulla echinocandica TaxID=2656787 RepID=A0A370TQU0_9HELO|nr:Uncharacterized protein BP5553_05338 [Venustampulla echinocandica]RDL37905.1 Uncharacterized protein BP5553_05338 [Venustampulla echinocandica]
MANTTRPVVEIWPGALSKRKRDACADAPHVIEEPGKETIHDAKRRKPPGPSGDETTQGSEDITEPQTIAAERKDDVTIRRIKDTIESQLGLEILLKHNELRLINQELAKCQIALEQLRRCHLIPYPASQGMPEAMLNVMNGTGATVGQKDNVPQWAPPYGVADGPYTRHYSKWLIPDPSFDGVHLDWQRTPDGSRAGKTVPEGRATRYSLAEGNTPGSKSRTQRGSAGQKLQALSSGYPPAKEKTGPCVTKRSDGQLVKLVCLDCKRDNFSSTQGFINHCRIAHRRDFKSHEEAAVASGQPIEVDEVGVIAGDDKSPAPAPPASGLVHPLIRSAPVEREAYVDLLSRIEASMDLFRQGKLPGVTSIPTGLPSTPLPKSKTKEATKPNKNFVPSSDTSRLSDLMRSRGFGSNLAELVTEAKTPVDFEAAFSSHDEDSDDGERTPQRPIGGLDGSDSPPMPAMRVPARANVPPAPFGRPGSSKGVDSKTGRKPGLSAISPRLSHATPVISTTTPIVSPPRPSTHLVTHQLHDHMDPHHDDHMDLDMMRHHSINDLSPNTVASNNAPSLVSDDGEYEEGDDADSVNSGNDEDSDVAEIDIDDDGVEKVVPRTVLRNRAGSGGDGVRLRKEDKHVTFVSPMKESGKGRRK